MLPRFFRHRRFQSLVRQLNFYSFRKVNKERTFWVYRHPMFHRDRADELHLLRRRTCPGVDGRKHRPELDISSLEAGAASTLDERGAPILPKRFTKKGAPEVTPTPTKRKSKKGDRDGNRTSTTSSKKARLFVTPPPPSTLAGGEESEDSSDDEAPVVSRSTTAGDFLAASPRGQARQISSDFTSSSAKQVHPLLSAPASLDEPTEQESRAEQKEQSLLVSDVARALEEHLKRARTAAGMSRKGKRSGVVTPSLITDTMKYNGLTYSDEIVEREEEVLSSFDMVKLEKEQKKLERKTASINDPAMVVSEESAESEADEDDDTSFASAQVSVAKAPVLSSTYHAIQAAAAARRSKLQAADLTKVPVSDSTLVSMACMKLLHGKAGNEASDEARGPSAVARFCMSTAPHDGELANKVLALLSNYKDLAMDFLRYRNALDPNSSSLDLNHPANIKQHALLVHQVLKGKSKSDDTIREFSIFMINRMESILAVILRGDFHGMCEDETDAVRRTIRVWRRSIVRA